MASPLNRQKLLDDGALRGVELCRAYSNRMDEWLGEVFADLGGAGRGMALVAVGGYGRAELSPQSDVDLLLVHDGSSSVDELRDVAEKVWYPIWDEGLKLGHAVRTVKEAIDLASGDLDTATALLSSRWVAGDAGLVATVGERAQELWRKRSKRFLVEMSNRVRSRHDKAGEVAFLLEPDLKEGRGGLRDVHAIAWARAAERVTLDEDDACIDSSYDLLLSVRVELGRITGRSDDRLVLQEQDAVASRLGFESADHLMAAVAVAGRCIAWVSDDTWDRIDNALSTPRMGAFRRDRTVGPGVVLREGRVALTADADPAGDPLLVLRAAAGAAEAGTLVERASLARLVEGVAPLPEPWPDEARELFVRLLLAGPPAIAVIEALDQKGLFVRLIPEWASVRSKPQRNAYHRFTVDRHLVEAAVEAAGLVDRVDRPDLLVVGTLLHDIGKGYPGDHTEVGLGLIRQIGTRMGFASDDVELMVDMCRFHLLLPDVATRRDLDDEATIRNVAEQVGSTRLLLLLSALTEADSLATGPAAWGAWKAELVGDLTEKALHVLGGGAAEDTTADFPTPAHLALMATGRSVIEGSDQTLTIVAPDRPGLFSRVAGVIALHGLDILSASVYSDDNGVALEVLRVESSFGPAIAWERVENDVARALEGRLALSARLSQRAQTYRRPPAPQVREVEPTVRFDHAASDVATVVEVHAPDGVGILYRVTRALAELDLDIRSAKIHTLGAEVVDAFYVRTAKGEKVADPEDLAEIERAVLHALSSGG